MPIAIADQIDWKGFPSSNGIACLSNVLKTDNALVLKMILKSGGIPLVKANVSQCTTQMHAINNIYGEALNPLNFQRVCGADEALVSAKCVPFSIGVDSGLSMQAKAAFSGVFSFRPTRGRISDDGLGY